MTDIVQGEERLPARVAEARLLEIASGVSGQKILAMSLGRAQAAEKIAADRPDATVACWFLDSFHAALAKEHVTPLANLSIECLVDWPERACDLAMVPLSMRGETELSRDLLQSAYCRLSVGGWLIASVDNPKDTWLHDQMKVFDKSVKVRPFEDATVYLVQKKQELKRVRDFSCELTFRDEEHTINIVTRPGVFSHREVDNGARQLLDAVDVFPEARLLDIGCGSGAVGIALAAREPTCQVLAVDSNARAVWCTQRGAELNGLSNVQVELNHSGAFSHDASFDMALANPPYYADFRIAELFITAAIQSLRPEGRLVLVTKQPKWYEENGGKWLDALEIFPSRRYFIVSGTKPKF
jgi:16S rRNA G1207 methylase RsmC